MKMDAERACFIKKTGKHERPGKGKWLTADHANSHGLALNDAAGGGGDGEGVAAGGFLQLDGRGKRTGQERGGEDGTFFAGGEGLAGFQKQGVGEEGHDFRDVMGDEDEGGRVRPAAEALEELEKMLARGGVEAGAGFVENQEARPGHERAANEHALAFALGKIKPGAFGEGLTFDLAQKMQGAGAVGAGDAAPVVDHGVLAADDGFEGAFVISHELADGGADEADVFAEFAPVGPAEAAAKDGDFADGGHEVTGDGAEERGFAGAIGAENGPMLAGIDPPVDVRKNMDTTAPDGEAGG